MSRRVQIQEVLRFLDLDGDDLLIELRREGLFEEEDLDVGGADELRVALVLMNELGVNAPGVDVVLQLRRRLLTLQGRMTDVLTRLLDETSES